jgi:hypothetical protein
MLISRMQHTMTALLALYLALNMEISGILQVTASSEAYNAVDQRVRCTNKDVSPRPPAIHECIPMNICFLQSFCAFRSLAPPRPTTPNLHPPPHRHRSRCLWSCVCALDPVVLCQTSLGMSAVAGPAHLLRHGAHFTLAVPQQMVALWPLVYPSWTRCVLCSTQKSSAVRSVGSILHLLASGCCQQAYCQVVRGAESRGWVGDVLVEEAGGSRHHISRGVAGGVNSCVGRGGRTRCCHYASRSGAGSRHGSMYKVCPRHHRTAGSHAIVPIHL